MMAMFTVRIRVMFKVRIRIKVMFKVRIRIRVTKEKNCEVKKVF